jgi:hypothetical protein
VTSKTGVAINMAFLTHRRSEVQIPYHPLLTQPQSVRKSAQLRYSRSPSHPNHPGEKQGLDRELERGYNSPHSMMGYMPTASERGVTFSGNGNVGGV